jgi:pyruvate formate lyase activating enzyme
VLATSQQIIEKRKTTEIIEPIAKWWSPKGEKILCELCPRYCEIGDGQPGFCFIRYNDGGVLRTKGYGRSTGFALDPIEKKPLYHVYPTKKILSFGTAGCNMGCRFCQNWDISKAKDDERMSSIYHARQIVDDAYRLKQTSRNVGLAFTYNDPTIWAEWAYDLALLAKERGLISVMVTNGYMTKQSIKDVYPVIEAANIDLKSFTENFYFKQTFSHLKPVLDGILWIKNEGTWIELTTLLITGKNDSTNEIQELCSWVKQYCGDETPLHFSAFHPDFKMMDVPHTPLSTLLKAYDIAKSTGLKYVYTGNVFDEETGSTYCPSCNKLLIRRNWYDVEIKGLTGNKCKHCGYVIKGIF